MKSSSSSPFILLAALSVIMQTPCAAAPGELVEGWPVQVDGVIFGAPAIGAGGEIVIGSEDQSVYSYNPDGSLRWVYAGANDWIDSSPTIGKDGTVYVGCWDNFLYALDGDSGALQWKFETDSLITASAAIGPDGTIYIGSYDEFMYALHPDGSLKWSFGAGEGFSPINGGAVLNHSGNTLYFGTNNGELYALDTATGAMRWVFSVPDVFTENREIFSPPTVGLDGSVYFGCENGRLYALSASGSRKWVFPAMESIESIKSSPITDANGTIYFASQDGYLYAVDEVGFQLWETFVGDVFYCSPALDSLGNIIIGAYAGNAVTGSATSFTSIDANGIQQWEYIIEGLNDSSPNIAPDGSIYIGAHDGFLYKFVGSAPLWNAGWPRAQANRRQTGWFDDLRTGELVDTFPAIAVAKDGWAHVPWFGAGWLRDAGLPWIEHLDHGYLYTAGASIWSVYFYDITLGEWFYAPTAAPNYYYRIKTGQWLYHWQGTNVYSGRWFFDFAQGAWIEEALLSQ